MNILDMKKRNVLITGAGQGVGRQAALHFAANNAGAVVVNDYFLERAEAVAGEIEAQGCKALAVQADVSNHQSVTAMAAKVASAVGAIDVLVNNAGNAGPNPADLAMSAFHTQDPARWTSMIGVNLYGVLHMVHAFMPGMIDKSYGRIITIVSDAGRVGEPGLEVYGAAKAGAAGFMRSIAKSGGRYGITANCVSLGTTRTPINTRELTAEEEKKALQRYVIRRFGEPNDAANMILFLGSDAASWITGQTIPVNGGYSFTL